MGSARSSNSRRAGGRNSSLELLPELGQTAGKPARDRPGRQFELLADRLVALITTEEAVEQIGTGIAELVQGLADGHRVVELGKGVVEAGRRQLLIGRLRTCCLAQAIKAEVPGQLGQPGLDRRVVAQLAQALVGARKDLLEDVLGVVLGKPKALDRDRVDVSREAFDELPPSRFVAVPAAGDELRVGQGCAHADATPDSEASRAPTTESATSRLVACPVTAAMNSSRSSASSFVSSAAVTV